MANWHIGQRVVCINDRFVGGYVGVDTLPTKGCVYTIRDIDLSRLGCISPVGLRFEEIVNVPHYFLEGMDETSFPDRKFRPVKDTSIEVFQQMLVTTPKREVVGAVQ